MIIDVKQASSKQKDAFPLKEVEKEKSCAKQQTVCHSTGRDYRCHPHLGIASLSMDREQWVHRLFPLASSGASLLVLIYAVCL